LELRLTRRRIVHSIRYGTFRAVERQGRCPQHPEQAPTRSEELPRLVAPGCSYAYDVLVRVGMARFLECRQDDQIREEMCRQHGIGLGLSTVSYLARKFAAYVQVVHQQSVSALRGAMKARGGYILHIDGTCEEASRVLLVCLDSRSMQVLESRRIHSENHVQVRDVLREVRRDWGVPLAIVHDLRRALITAAGEIFPSVRQFVCHFHLAADVGKDILSPHRERLRCVFRRTEVRAKLRELMRSLKRFAICEDSGDPLVKVLLSLPSTKELREHCTADSVKGAVHGLAAWILAYAQDGEGYGFPFDVAYLDFYERLIRAHQMLAAAAPLEGEACRGPLRELNRLRQILEPVISGEPSAELRRIVAEAKRDRRVFERFRSALRICPHGGTNRRNDDGAPGDLSATRHRRVLLELRTSLACRVRRNDDSARACKIVVQHLDKYWDYLFGHSLQKNGGKIIVPRTNNDEERFFRTIKRQCRRLHGRKDLSHDLESMPPAVPLVMNLTNQEYCETVYGGSEPERIADRFCQVDPQIPVKLLQSWRQERISHRMPHNIEKQKNLPKRLAGFFAMAVRELRD